MRIGSLCTGYGGLDMAVRDVLGGSLAWVADVDPAAATVLAHRHPDVPNLGDIRAVDWTSVDPVDVVTAGFPCQPVSVAGRHGGTADERWIFDDITAAIGRMGTRPGLLLLENVVGLLSANGGDAMARVVHGLAALGYMGRYRVLAAADVGAPHRRERVFILAEHPHTERCGRRRWRDGSGETPSGRPSSQAHRLGETLATADPGRVGIQRRRDGNDVVRASRGEPDVSPPGRVARDRRSVATHTTRDGRHQRRPEPAGQLRRHDATERGRPDWGPYAGAIHRWENVTGRAAPGPTVLNRTGRPVLDPPFVEWLMGLPNGWVTEVPGLSRTARLRLLGNGVVPQQAAAAIAELLDVEEVAA